MRKGGEVGMKYTIEFELPDNDFVLKGIKTQSVKWSVWGYSGYCYAKPKKSVETTHPKTNKHGVAKND